ncbi:hypothetical protein ACFY9N_05835 [Microbacterium sp. NPDC008134]|uniref:hypothetical protein n=1 Tax=Microbacterium sp. NPDC008134 TaxID=3364183 RepID=UPI0036E49A81
MANGISGDGEAAQRKRGPGRPRKYETEENPLPRPIPVNWHIEPSAHARLTEIQKATEERPGAIASKAIEYYYKHEFPSGDSTPKGGKA